MTYVARVMPEVIAVPIGAFADPDAFPAPWAEVYQERKFDGVEVTPGEVPDTPQS